MHIISNLKRKAKQLKLDAQVLIIAYSDKRTPIFAKILIGLTIGYLLSPIDLIPDFIPVLGLIDDLILVPILISFSLKLIPLIVLSQAKESLINNPQKNKKNNWIFAIIIVFIWLIVVYYLFNLFAYLWPI